MHQEERERKKEAVFFRQGIMYVGKANIIKIQNLNS